MDDGSMHLWQDTRSKTHHPQRCKSRCLCVMFIQCDDVAVLVHSTEEKEEEENNKNKQRIKTQNDKSSLNNLHTLNLQKVIPKYSTNNYEIPAGHFKHILCTPCCWLESARQWSRKALCQLSSGVHYTHKLCSWTIIRFGKEPKQHFANSMVVCAIPNTLCSWTMIKSGTEPKK